MRLMSISTHTAGYMIASISEAFHEILWRPMGSVNQDLIAHDKCMLDVSRMMEKVSASSWTTILLAC